MRLFLAFELPGAVLAVVGRQPGSWLTRLLTLPWYTVPDEGSGTALFPGTPLTLFQLPGRHRVRASALSGKFPPLLWASFRRQLCCATLKDARPSCVARLTVNENPSQINNANFPDSTLVTNFQPLSPRAKLQLQSAETDSWSLKCVLLYSRHKLQHMIKLHRESAAQAQPKVPVNRR